MKRLLCALLALMLLLGSFAALAEDTGDQIVEPTLSPDAEKYDPEHPEDLSEDQLYAQSAILIEANTGFVIFEKNADAIMYPASTTKILTTLLGLMMVEDLDQTVIVSETAADVPSDSSHMSPSLQVGEEISFRDILYGTLMVSDNMAANVIAETVSGSIGAFVDLMNQAVATFGCTSTHFANAHGYHDFNHYTTVRDMALIAKEAMKDPTFREIVSTVNYTIPRSQMARARNMTTKSRIMIPPTEENDNKYYYEFATGIKTGSHSQAGYCFVGSAEKEGVELISVVFYTSNRGRWSDTKKLMEYGFSQYTSVTPVDLYNMNPITIDTNNYSLKDTNMGRLPLSCVPAEKGKTVKITATNEEIEIMASNLRSTMLIEFVRDFKAPIEAGEVIGTMTYFQDNGNEVTYNLIASRSVNQRENAPPTLEEIVEMTEKDPNPFPPITVEFVLSIVLPIAAVWFLIATGIKHIKRRRKKKVKIKNNIKQYLK
ncbi:MAG: D-alanyl-D-alanine carboxypeptidase family protein [Clostridia bacterium]|nr:D-alanyl-D-alanine carboxypeptidase family protein [Clostridia bacterium]